MPSSPVSPSDDGRHVPVMLDDVLSALDPHDAEVFVDGTFGAGGYSRAILAAANTQVIGIDRDQTAVAGAMDLVSSAKGRLTVTEDRFSQLDRVARSFGHEAVDGVVLDIGVSSMQLDEGGRGFSFRQDGPLDMRMEGRGRTAADLVNTLDEATLARIFGVFGEERRARSLARAIVADRARTPFLRTRDLAELCSRVIRAKPTDIHPATRAFQALRIVVNGELDELAEALLASERILRPGGKLAVVTFHSLEDRIVKAFLADRERREAGGSRHFPQAKVPPPTFEPIHRGAVAASEEESKRNPRARSAKLRAARRTAAPARDTGTIFLDVPEVDIGAGRGR
jgi:16S rRNA (cytosine1402-N4)-methyltransferase